MVFSKALDVTGLNMTPRQFAEEIVSSVKAVPPPNNPWDVPKSPEKVELLATLLNKKFISYIYYLRNKVFYLFDVENKDLSENIEPDR